MMAFDPLLPKTFEQHVSSDGRVRTLVRVDSESGRDASAVREANRGSLRDIGGSLRDIAGSVRDIDSTFSDARKRETESPAERSRRWYAPFRPLVKFGTALVIFDTAFVGLAQIGWTEIVRDWLAIRPAQALALAAYAALVNILAFYTFGAYRREVLTNVAGLSSRVAAALALSGAVLFLTLQYATDVIDSTGPIYPDTMASAGLALIGTWLSLGSFVLSRAVSYSLLARRCFTHRVLVVGSGKRARYLKDLMGHGAPSLANELFFAPETVIDNDRSNRSKAMPPLSDWADGPIDDLARALQIDEIVVAIDEGQQFTFEPFVACKANGIPVVSYNCFIERETKRVDLNRPDLAWLVYSQGFRQSTVDAVLKRSLDIVVSAALLFVSAPVLLLATMFVAAGRDGPVFFKQQRVTKDGQLFWLYKIRTMRQDAERNGPQWSSAADPRITCVGAILRRFRIDEIPQLVNVLRGDMSLVGPRPEQPFFVEQLTREIRLYSVRHTVKAGITGWAQINYPYGATKADAIRKLEYELYYIKNHSFLQELSILVQTVRVLFWPPRAN
jgi:sugar transferase (PEP-CTERM system associated)